MNKNEVKKQENIEDENKKRLKKIAMYTAIFVFAIFVVVFNRIFGEQNTTKTPNNEIKEPTTIMDNLLLKTLENIDNNNYSMDIHLTLDDDAISLQYQKLNDLLIGVKKYHKEETEFIKYNDKYYHPIEDSVEELNTFIDFDYDTTFINLENIKILLNTEGESITYTSNEYNVTEYTYDLKDIILKFENYSKYALLSSTRGSIYVTSYEKNNNLSYIEIDITSLYNLVNNASQQEVKYKITVSPEKTQDTSWLLEKLN